MKRKTALIIALAMSLSMTAYASEDASGEAVSEDSAVQVTMSDTIETDKFTMSFDSFEILEDFSIPTGENSSLSPSKEDGYQFAVLRGQFENTSSSSIDTYVFDISFTANGEYEYGNGVLDFASNNYFEIESLGEKEYYIYVKIPDNLVNIFETGVFTLSFKSDLTSISTSYSYVDGETVATTDADCEYKINCTSSESSEAAADTGSEEAPAEEDSAEGEGAVLNFSIGEDGKFHISMSDAIETEKFKMTFESFEILEDFSIPTGENSSLSPSKEDGYQFAVLRGQFENYSSSSISTYVFDISFMANGEYEYEDGILDFASSNYFEIESLGEKEYYIYVKVPDKLAEIYETGVFDISFKDDLSSISTSYSYVDGETVATTDVDYTYAVNCSFDEPAEAQASETPAETEGESESGEIETTALNIGETIVADGYEFTLSSVELTSEVLPTDTSGVYMSYTADSGKVYIDISGSYYNTSKEDVCVRDLPMATADYDGGYTYKGFAVVDVGNSFDWADSYIICTPLETCRYHCLIECPEIVNETDAPLYILLPIDGVIYRYDIRA